MHKVPKQRLACMHHQGVCMSIYFPICLSFLFKEQLYNLSLCLCLPLGDHVRPREPEVKCFIFGRRPRGQRLRLGCAIAHIYTLIYEGGTRDKEMEREDDLMGTSRQKTPGGTADHGVLGILMPVRRSRGCCSRSILPIVRNLRSVERPTPVQEHRHSGYANDNEPGITIHITQTCSRGRYYVPSRAIAIGWYARNELYEKITWVPEDRKDATKMASDICGLKSEFITRGISATRDEFIDVVELNCLRLNQGREKRKDPLR